jgi:hypothetical protein
MLNVVVKLDYVKVLFLIKIIISAFPLLANKNSPKPT